MSFRNRHEAGRLLADSLESLIRKMGIEDPLVLALPRGGAPVAAEVALRLKAPIDVLVVRKIGAPGNPEFGIGAIGEDGAYWLNPDALAALGLDEDELQTLIEQERWEVARRVRRFRGGRAMLPVKDRDIILVDDGLATGGTARVALEILRSAGARRRILAVPVAPPEALDALRASADGIVALETPEAFFSVGGFYDDFAQLSDEDVAAAIDEVPRFDRPRTAARGGARGSARTGAPAASRRHAGAGAGAAGGGDFGGASREGARPRAAGAPSRAAGDSERVSESRDVATGWAGRSPSAMRRDGVIKTKEGLELPGTLDIPENCEGVVIFAHGSGSSRFSPRNMEVARELARSHLGTLLFDLLTPEEAEDRRKVFDIPLLADRLLAATSWLREQAGLESLPIGYFGASTGGGAALWAAADQGDRIAAVVSRGGRPDLALSRLALVRAPTLLIVGGEDEPVISMNRQALRALPEGKLVIIAGATHLFEEPGALKAVADNAARWFIQQFRRERGGTGVAAA